MVCCPHPAQITLVPCDEPRLYPPPPPTLLFVLLGLAARFAALRRRITTFAEEFLILGGKRECLPAIAAHELLIFSHISLSSMLLVCVRSKNHRTLLFCLGRSRSRPTHPQQSPLNSLTGFLRLRRQMNSALSCQTGMNSVCVEGKGCREFPCHSSCPGASARKEQRKRCRRALESSRKPARTGKMSRRPLPGDVIQTRQPGRSRPASLSALLRRRTRPPGLP